MAKKPPSWQQHDPDYQREQRRYEHPIPSRNYILQALEAYDAPMSFSALTSEIGVRGQGQREGLKSRLRAMVRDGQIIRNRREEYCLIDRIPVIVGKVTGHRDGFGFLIPDEGEDDIYLSPVQMREVMHGDRIAVRVKGYDRRGRPEGSLVEVLARAHKEIAGRYIHEGGLGFVVPDNTRISQHVIIPPGKAAGAKPSQMVVASIDEYPTRNSETIGQVVEVLGAPDEPGIETEIAIRSFGLPHEWPDEAAAQAAKFPKTVTTAAKRGRTDYRDLPLVTIDGADARDFDDAVYAKRTPSGWRLIVAIADVSHYVANGAPLDREAHKRGTSVYFPQRVIPMLPENLSNGLCSLNPKVDRLCMVCEMLVDKNGEVTRAAFREGVMRSHARLTYTQVANALVEQDAKEIDRLDALMPMLRELHEMYRAMAKARQRRGAIDFDMPNVQAVFHEDGPDKGRIRDIVRYERNDAHKIIEECMIAANVQAARFLLKHKVPALYRRHDSPKQERVDALRSFLGTLGLRLDAGARGKAAAKDRSGSQRKGQGKDKHKTRAGSSSDGQDRARIAPKQLRDVLIRARGREDVALIETVVLRTMALAVYHPESQGHFGLALGEYAHFTSPIRRYPDLLVHRGIRHILRGGKAGDFAYSPKAMEALGRQCSETERRAEEASREVMDWLKCELMQDALGKSFDATVTGVTDFGLFVELKKLPVEGLVHVSSLGSDYFVHEPDHHRLVGRRSGKSFRLADPIRVRVTEVDMDNRKIDFDLADGGDRRESAGRGKSKGRGKDKGKGQGRGKGQGKGQGKGKSNGEQADSARAKGQAEGKSASPGGGKRGRKRR